MQQALRIEEVEKEINNIQVDKRMKKIPKVRKSFKIINDVAEWKFNTNI